MKWKVFLAKNYDLTLPTTLIDFSAETFADASAIAEKLAAEEDKFVIGLLCLHSNEE
jgi:hypothetical protein